METGICQFLNWESRILVTGSCFKIQHIDETPAQGYSLSSQLKIGFAQKNG